MKKPRRPHKSINVYYFLPIIIFRVLFDKVFNTFISILNKTNLLSGRYYYSKNFNHSNNFDYLHKVSIKYIANKKLRYSLYLTSLFKKWHVYLIKDVEETNTHTNKRQLIYISRDNIKKGDEYVGERINDTEINKLFKPKYRKQRRKKGVRTTSDEYKLDFQYYVLCSKFSKLHKDLNKYSSDKYYYKNKVELKKAVKKAIKTANFNTSRPFTGKRLGASLIEHLLHYKKYEYLGEIYYSLDILDKEDFIEILEEYVDDNGIYGERREHINKLKEVV